VVGRGCDAGSDVDKGKKVIGSIMGKQFREPDTLEVDGHVVVREERYVCDDLPGSTSFKLKTYTVSKPPSQQRSHRSKGYN
jgi:hypothetical protein